MEQQATYRVARFGSGVDGNLVGMTTYKIVPDARSGRMSRYFVIAVEKGGAERQLMVFDDEREARACIASLSGVQRRQNLEL